MLRCSGLSMRRGRRELLHDATFSIYPGQRVGITGANGVGKSSLFALIRGELHADAGNCDLPSSWVLSHVAQETPAVQSSAVDYVLDGDRELREIEAAITLAETQQHGERLGELHAKLDAISGYSARSRATTLLHGLGFEPGQENNRVASFSGGWRMRLNLAQALMCRSDLLLLDEPTNHLDLETVLWLEDWLLGYQGTLLLISHDRDFLDRVVTHIANIENAVLTVYSGNYSAFEEKRSEQLAQQQALYQKQQKEITHMQQFVTRFKAKASKAKQAQSRLKALERMDVISQAHVDSPFHFSFRRPDSSPDMLLYLEEMSVAYEEKAILSGVSMAIRNTDRIGLLGQNGAGKSTLIRVLAGEKSISCGERKEAKNLRIGYFAQHQLEQLDLQATPLVHMQRLDARATEQSLRTFLGGFGFDGDMVSTEVAPFSGGEKARLVLAMLVYQKPNLLLLDEPTNHLDLEMRLALTTALLQFEGAMIIVSHDRHLLRTAAETLMLVEAGKLSDFQGDLDDYYQHVRAVRREGNTKQVGASATTAGNKKQQRQSAAQQRQRIQPLQNQLKKLDRELERITLEKAQLDAEIALPELYDEKNKERLMTLIQQQQQLQEQLSKTEEEWMQVSEELEALRR